ncbi:ABC transporter permease [Xylanimonas sp. McL0601]|uniref:ABC transporter permease n=1 Tax=Xylanimonas sp. McL0601 TaxID=3414739 RepID=UPI003CF91025
MTGPLATACAVELLKLRRSVIAFVVTPLIALVVPLASYGAVWLARSPDLPGTAAAKFQPFADGPVAVANLSVCGQILSVAVLGACGFAAAWSYGRELTGGTAGALFGHAVPRQTVALAKGLVLLAWLAGCVLVAVGLSAALSRLGGGTFPPEAWSSAWTALAVGWLAVGLGLPFGWVATIVRSPFATVGILIGLVAVTQVIVVLGAGTWFPYAAPSLWAGMGGPDAAAAVPPAALLLAAALAPAGLVVVVRAWSKLTNV